MNTSEAAIAGTLALAGFFAAWAFLAGFARLLPADFLAVKTSERSNHSHPVRQIGGLALAAALFAVLAAFWGLPSGTEAGVAAGALCMFLTGFADDLFELGPRAKFGAQAASVVVAGLSAGAGLLLPGGWAIWLLAAIALIYWVNAVNFMDGIDLLIVSGLALPLAVLALLVISADQNNPAAAAGLAVSGGLAAFALFNRPPASIFLGDSGSLLAGFICGALIVSAMAVLPPAAVIAPFTYFLIDTISTIMLRLKRRENIFRAHSGHAYQIAKRGGLSAAQVSAQVFGITALLSALSVLAAFLPGAGPQLAVTVAAVLAASGFAFHLRRKGRQSSLQ